LILKELHAKRDSYFSYSDEVGVISLKRALLRPNLRQKETSAAKNQQYAIKHHRTSLDS